MSQLDKLKEEIKAVPSDFTWKKLTKLLRGVGFEESQKGKTSGSRVRFYMDGYPPINLHKPHPGSIVNQKTVKDVKEYLETNGLI